MKKTLLGSAPDVILCSNFPPLKVALRTGKQIRPRSLDYLAPELPGNNEHLNCTITYGIGSAGLLLLIQYLTIRFLNMLDQEAQRHFQMQRVNHGILGHFICWTK